jgi:erythromycin esterase-like protein
MWNLNSTNKFFRLFEQHRQKDINIFLSWAHEHSVAIEPLDGFNTDIDRFSSFDGLLENKRVVYLGEEDHWIHEKSDYRLLLLRYLISRGFRYIGEELGWSDGMRIDRFLETGDESYLDSIATYGYKSAIRTDRDDKPPEHLKPPMKIIP